MKKQEPLDATIVAGWVNSLPRTNIEARALRGCIVRGTRVA